MSNEIKPPGQEPTVEELQQTRSRRLKPSLKIDKEAVVAFVLDNLRNDLDDRSDWNSKRMERYAKLRGWLPEKDFPIGNYSSNIWIPIMLITSMRLKASLENAVKSTRPLMQAKATQRRNVEREENISRLLDFQIFDEADGETQIDSFINNFVDDGTAIAFIRWVKKDETIRDVRILPGLPRDIPEDVPIRVILGQAVDALFNEILAMAPQQDSEYPDWDYDVVYRDAHGHERHALVSFYETEDTKLEACITQRVTTYDGPAIEIEDLEDIVIPIRCANLQPPGPENPYGALYVNRICKTNVDAIIRLKLNGTYDLLDDEGLERIRHASNWPQGTDEDQPKEQKDLLLGVMDNRRDKTTRYIVESYARWDIDGDGLEEDVIFWVERETKLLLRARLLSDVYPGLPIRRPFAESRLFPIPNSFYGVGMPELEEPLQDLLKTLIDMNFDWGLITNVPFGFYRPASGIKREDMTLKPGTLYPVDRPQEDIVFPTWNRDMSWVVNTFTMLRNLDDKLAMQSDLQFGKVPTGQASALRTLGTTAALLQQGDMRSEQILRRLFHGIAQIFSIVHRLDRRYLPKHKEIRVLGASEQGEEPFADLTNDQIDADVDFDFRATMLNTNKQVVGQALNEIASLLVSPIALQAGLVTPENFYKLFRDMIKSKDFDPDRYLQRPPMAAAGPKLLAEEVISTILAGEIPVGQPMEPPADHFAKLQAFIQSDQVGLLNDSQMKLFASWMQNIMLLLQQMMQQQQLMAAVAQSEGGPESELGGVPTTFAVPPQPQSEGSPSSPGPGAPLP
ncbi:MAG: portal protein [Nitrososphaerales archaeon]